MASFANQEIDDLLNLLYGRKKKNKNSKEERARITEQQEINRQKNQEIIEQYCKNRNDKKECAAEHRRTKKKGGSPTKNKRVSNAAQRIRSTSKKWKSIKDTIKSATGFGSIFKLVIFIIIMILLVSLWFDSRISYIREKIENNDLFSFIALLAIGLIFIIVYKSLFPTLDTQQMLDEVDEEYE